MSRTSNLFVLIAAAMPLALTACTSSDVIDDLAGEEGDGDAAGKADGGPDTFDYYTIRRDMRRCVAPACGGYWVAKVNKEDTKCAVGGKAAECYVAELDLAALGGNVEGTLAQAEAGTALLRGSLVKKTYPLGTFGNFVLEEAWVAGTANGNTDGIFVKVEQTGVRCIAAPCEDKAEYKLNSVRDAMIADLDFEPSGANEDEISKAFESMLGTGLIVVGDRYYTRIDGRSGKSRTVNQFYTRVPSGAVEAECHPTGCSGQICSDQDVITTCEYRDEYACYETATCERQPEGNCGWTPTEELEQCLASGN